MRLRGVEALTLELPGRMPAGAARALTGDLPLRLCGADALVELLLFQMRDLRAGGRTPAIDYGEALWRVGVLVDGAPAWFGALWHLDHPGMLLGARWLWHAPVRRARFEFSGGDQARIAVRARGVSLSLRASATAQSPPPTNPLRCVYRRREGLYEVSWAESPAPFRRVARVEIDERTLVDATLGQGVRLDVEGLLHRGRVHLCDSAVRLLR